MRNNGFYDGGYQRRRELRRAYEAWVAQTDVDLFVTISPPENMGVAHARRRLRLWLAFIDSHYLRHGWTDRHWTERTRAFIFAESVDANLHYHAAMLLPERGRLQDLKFQAATLERLWLKLEPRGKCDVRSYRDAGGAKYVTKQLVRPGYLDYVILANDFHPERHQHTNGRGIIKKTSQI